MPYTWKIDPQARTIDVRGWGPMDIEESLRAPHDLLADPGFDPSYGVVVDLRELEFEPQADALVAVSQNLIGIREKLRSRLAIVVAEEHATAAELGAAMAGAGGFELGVFTDPEAAWRWARAEGEDASR